MPTRAQKGMFVITDGKRNDIGTTMEAYAAAHLGKTDVFGERTLIAVRRGRADRERLSGHGRHQAAARHLRMRKIRAFLCSSRPRTRPPVNCRIRNWTPARPFTQRWATFCEHWGENCYRQIRLLRRRRGRRRDVPGSSSANCAIGAAAHLLPGARLRRTGRRRG